MTDDLKSQVTYWSDKANRFFGGALGGLAGVTLGGALGGPVGAAVGGAVGTVLSGSLTDIGKEMSGRLLSPREEARVGQVFVLAAREIIQRQHIGEQVRNDGFFNSADNGRCDAQEVRESILLKSQREPEEKKLPYMAHLLAAISFGPSISVHMAHQLTKVAEQLTYRQLCILKVSAQKENFRLRKGSYRGQKEFELELLQLLYEYHDLYSRGYINFGGSAALALTDVDPGNTVVQGMGVHTYNLMMLQEIPPEDLYPVIQWLH